MVIKIKRNDTKGEFTDTLTVGGDPVDLTDAIVSWLIRKTGASFKRPAVITYPLDQSDPLKRGKVSYQPIAEDVANKGTYRQEWEVVFSDGEILTFPNDRYNTLEILEDLG